MTAPVQPRPQPVVDAAKLGGLVGTAFVSCGGAIFIVEEGISRDNLGAAGIAVTAAVTALVALGVYASSLLHGKAAAQQVTPVVDPVSAGGEQLVPVSAYGQRAILIRTPATPDQPADTSPGAEA